jgi:hypothetical protein
MHKHTLDQNACLMALLPWKLARVVGCKLCEQADQWLWQGEEVNVQDAVLQEGQDQQNLEALRNAVVELAKLRQMVESDDAALEVCRLNIFSPSWQANAVEYCAAWLLQ